MKNYGREGSSIIRDNCQIAIYGGFAPNSEAAEVLSKTLGERTVQTGSVSKGKDTSKSLQMTGRALMTPDELKIMPKDTFIVTRTGVKPMKTVLRLFFEWGIELNEPYKPRRSTVRKVSYANRASIEKLVSEKYGRQMLLDENREMLKEQRKAAVQQEAAEWAAKNENTERMRNVKT